MWSLKPKSFYESLWPTFTLSLIFGIFPVLPYKNENGHMKLYSGWKCKLLTGLNLFMYIGIFAVVRIFKLNNIAGKNYYSRTDTVPNFGVTTQFAMGVVIFFMTMIGTFIFVDRVRPVFEKLNKIDLMLRAIGEENFDYAFVLIYQILVNIIGVLAICLNTFFQNRNLKVENFKAIHPLVWCIFITPLIHLNLTVNQFSITVYTIYKRFNITRRQLLKILDQMMRFDNKKIETISKNEKLEYSIKDKITSLMKVCDILHSIEIRTNKNYNFLLFPGLGSQFFLIVYQIFYVYWMSSLRPNAAIIWTIWAIIKHCEVIHFCTHCHRASREGELIGRSVHKLINSNSNKDIQDLLISFSQQILHSKFSFKLYGLFNLDWTLLFNIYGSATTFIVILIQFQEATTPSATCFANTTNIQLPH